MKSDKIDWKEGKNLCEKVKIKTQKHKKTGNIRKIKKSIPQMSFFHCFKNRDLENEPDSEDMEVTDIEIDYDLEGVSDAMQFIKDFMLKYGPPSYFEVPIPDYQGSSKYNFCQKNLNLILL